MPGASANRPYALLAQYYDEFFTDHLSRFRQARRELLGTSCPAILAFLLAAEPFTSPKNSAQRVVVRIRGILRFAIGWSNGGACSGRTYYCILA
jgi:hypothetical protein